MKFILSILLLLSSVVTQASKRDKTWFQCDGPKVCSTHQYSYIKIVKVTNAEFHAQVRDFVDLVASGPRCAVLVKDNETRYIFNSGCTLQMSLINGYRGGARIVFQDNWDMTIQTRPHNDPFTDALSYNGTNSQILSLSGGGTRRIGNMLEMNIGFDNEIFYLQTLFDNRHMKYTFDDFGFFVPLNN